MGHGGAGVTAMVDTGINGRWTLKLPDYRAERPEWATGWERERLDAMHDLIEPGDTVLDVGAEEGDLSALYALWGADVVLVEPNPLAWPNIRAIFEANGLAGMVRGSVVGFLAAEARGEPGVLLGGAHGAARARGGGDRWAPWWPDCAFGPMVKAHGFLTLDAAPGVGALTLDGLVERRGCPPTVVTVDVEGAEADVLAGGPVLFSTDRPAVFVSVHVNLPGLDETHPDDLRDRVAAVMAGHGYEGRLLAVDHEEHWEWRHPGGR
jgi:hypothetical protein